MTDDSFHHILSFLELTRCMNHRANTCPIWLGTWKQVDLILVGWNEAEKKHIRRLVIFILKFTFLNTQISSFTGVTTLANQLPGARCLPRAHEMLFCAPNTSWPQLDAFLSRCRHVQGGWWSGQFTLAVRCTSPKTGWKIHHELKMDNFLLNMGIFQCHVSELRGVV